MPVQVSYPGVYIQEVPSGVHTITGVSTSIAAFLGRTSKGPTNRAIRILSLADYVRTFGPPHPRSDLANSVKQFFANGGSDAYVVRLARGADFAEVTLRSLAAASQNVLVATAKAEGVWANTVRLEVDYNTPNPDETFNLRVIQEEAGVAVATESFTGLTMNPNSARFAPDFVTQSSGIIDLALDTAMTTGDFINQIGNSFTGFSMGRRPIGATAAAVRTALNALITAAGPTGPSSKFDIVVNDNTPVTVDLAPGWPAVMAGAANLTTIEDHIQARINAALNNVSPLFQVDVDFVSSGPLNNMVHIHFQVANTGGDKVSIRVRRSSANDIASALMLGVDQGGIEPVRWSNFRPAPSASLLLFAPGGTLTFPGMVANLNTLSGLLQQTIASLTIDGTLVNFDLRTTNPAVLTHVWFETAPAFSPVNNDSDGVREKLGIIAGAINATAGLPYKAELWGYHLAILAKDGPANTMPGSITTGTASFDNVMIRNVRQYSLGTSGVGASFPFAANGVDGTDGLDPQFAEYMGDPTLFTGFFALDPVDLFNLMILPGDLDVLDSTMMTVWGPASNYCATRRAFLIVDPPANWSKNGQTEVAYKTNLISDLKNAGVNKENSAVFYPRLKYNANGLIKTIGPAGAIAGLMARTDSSRGVWKAPAGVEADIRDIVGLEVKLTDAQNGVLNKLAVNCLRLFPSGTVNWGARTLDGDDDSGSEWKYIPIRRLALFLEESLFRGTKWVVFEPNDEPLWASIRLNLNAFMMGLFRQGAFQGSTPDKAFFVKCDGETTTQADRNLGIVNIEVGFAPLKPAEFVIIKIQQIAGDL